MPTVKRNQNRNQQHTPAQVLVWVRGMLQRETTNAECLAATLRACIGALERVERLSDKPQATEQNVPGARARPRSTIDDRQRELYGDFDAMARSLADTLQVEPVVLGVVLHRAADLIMVERRGGVRRPVKHADASSESLIHWRDKLRRDLGDGEE